MRHIRWFSLTALFFSALAMAQAADGPFFMAKLPAGTYSVNAVYEGKSQASKVTLRDGRLRTEYLRWPSNPKQDLPVSRWLEPEEQPKPKAGSGPGS